MKRVLGIALLVLAIASVAGWFVLRFADGPSGPIPGGRLVRGELVDSARVDWQALLGDRAVSEIELQLVAPVGSRTTGAFVHAGELYVPCDLGFVWRRIPNATARRVLHLIWLFKRWHEDALVDGRVIVRAAGKRYERQAVRVTDPQLLAELRAHVAGAAAAFFGELLAIEANPDDIWFFRLDPRTATDGTR